VLHAFWAWTALCFGFGHTSDVVSSFSLILLMLRDCSWFACAYILFNLVNRFLCKLNIGKASNNWLEDFCL
jgi:hypothetical protein